MIPRPRKPIRSAGIAVSSPTGGFDAKPLAGSQLTGALAGQLLPVELLAPARPVLTPASPRRGVAATLGDQREAHLAQRLQLAHHPVAAAVAPDPARPPPQRV